MLYLLCMQPKHIHEEAGNGHLLTTLRGPHADACRPLKGQLRRDCGEQSKKPNDWLLRHEFNGDDRQVLSLLLQLAENGFT